MCVCVTEKNFLFHSKPHSSREIFNFPLTCKHAVLPQPLWSSKRALQCPEGRHREVVTGWWLFYGNAVMEHSSLSYYRPVVENGGACWSPLCSPQRRREQGHRGWRSKFSLQITLQTLKSVSKKTMLGISEKFQTENLKLKLVEIICPVCLHQWQNISWVFFSFHLRMTDVPGCESQSAVAHTRFN